MEALTRSSAARPSDTTGTVKTGAGITLEAKEVRGVGYTSSVMRSCTLAAKAASWAVEAPPRRWKRRLTSTRSTLPRPQEAQMLTALADQAVLKFIPGPNWRRFFGGRGGGC